MKKKLVATTVATTLFIGSMANVVAAPESHADSRRIGVIIGITAGALSAVGLSSAAVAATVSSHDDPGVPPVPPEEPPVEQPEPPVEQPEAPAEQPVYTPAPVQQAPAPVADAPRQQIASVPSGATELAPGVARHI